MTSTLFAVSTLLSLLLIAAGNYLLVSEELYFNALSAQLSYDQIKELLTEGERWSWLTYAILPLFNLCKFTLVATCLSLGYYLISDRWLFRPFFRVAIQAEFVLLVPGLVKILWFLFVQTDYTLVDLQIFYPLSLLSLVGANSVAPYLVYPLQVLNLFELVYWLVLAYGLAQQLSWTLERGMSLVASAYGTGLLLWIVLVMFISVSLS